MTKIKNKNVRADTSHPRTSNQEDTEHRQSRTHNSSYTSPSLTPPVPGCSNLAPMSGHKLEGCVISVLCRYSMKMSDVSHSDDNRYKLIQLEGVVRQVTVRFVILSLQRNMLQRNMHINNYHSKTYEGELHRHFICVITSFL